MVLDDGLKEPACSLFIPSSLHTRMENIPIVRFENCWQLINATVADYAARIQGLGSVGPGKPRQAGQGEYSFP